MDGRAVQVLTTDSTTYAGDARGTAIGRSEGGQRKGEFVLDGHRLRPDIGIDTRDT